MIKYGVRAHARAHAHIYTHPPPPLKTCSRGSDLIRAAANYMAAALIPLYSGYS